MTIFSEKLFLRILAIRNRPCTYVYTPVPTYTPLYVQCICYICICYICIYVCIYVCICTGLIVGRGKQTGVKSNNENGKLNMLRISYIVTGKEEMRACFEVIAEDEDIVSMFSPYQILSTYVLQMGEYVHTQMLVRYCCAG